MKYAQVVAITLLTGALLCSASDIEESRAGSRSRLWQQHAKRLDEILKKNISDEDRRAEVFGLLQSENNLIEQTLRDSKETVSVSAKYGEGFSEYYARLLDVAVSMADFSDSRQLTILANSSYNPDSKLAKQLARAGDRVVDIFLKLAHSDLSVKRADAVAMLRTIIENNRDRQIAQRSLIERAVEHSLDDNSAVVREEAVRAAAIVGDEEWIPRLTQIASQDPAHSGDRFPIREEANRSIAAIRARDRH